MNISDILKTARLAVDELLEISRMCSVIGPVVCCNMTRFYCYKQLV